MRPATLSTPRRSLSSLSSSGLMRQLALDEIGYFFLDICSGLLHLHQLHILHRDLKPQNILATRDLALNRVRLLLADFGECGVLDDHPSSTANTSFVRKAGTAGTIEYMAPEIIASILFSQNVDNSFFCR